MLCLAWNEVISKRVKKNCFNLAGFSTLLSDPLEETEANGSEPIIEDIYNRVSSVSNVYTSLNDYIPVDENIFTIPVLTDGEIVETVQDSLRR